eukprot:scaffold7535_cov376-Prasinococcus_capsulatus_cf.AAC.1
MSCSASSSEQVGPFALRAGLSHSRACASRCSTGDQWAVVLPASTQDARVVAMATTAPISVSDSRMVAAHPAGGPHDSTRPCCGAAQPLDGNGARGAPVQPRGVVGEAHAQALVFCPLAVRGGLAQVQRTAQTTTGI